MREKKPTLVSKEYGRSELTSFKKKNHVFIEKNNSDTKSHL